MPEHPNSKPLPEPWQSPITGQIFYPAYRWSKPDVELIDWQTNCRRCGTTHIFTLRADYSEAIATRMCLRWHGLCSPCRKGGAA